MENIVNDPVIENLGVNVGQEPVTDTITQKERSLTLTQCMRSWCLWSVVSVWKVLVLVMRWPLTSTCLVPSVTMSPRSEREAGEQ